MKILALDTSTEACSVAINIDGDITEESVIAPQQQAQRILPMVDKLLQKTQLTLAELDAIAFGAGPGSFTGLRIAAGVVQGLAYAAKLPVIPVSTLQALAQTAFNQYDVDQVIACLDARMQEIYCGWYQADKALAADKVCPPAAVYQPSIKNWLAIGTGWKVYQKELLATIPTKPKCIMTDAYPQAASIAQLAAIYYKQEKMVNAAEAIPVYLRDKVTG